MKEKKVSTHEFKTHFSSLVRAMRAGEIDRVLVSSHKELVGVFQLHEDHKPKRQLGLMQDDISMNWDDFHGADTEIEAEIYKNL